MAVALAYVLVLQVVLVHGAAARMQAESGFSFELCLTGDSLEHGDDASHKVPSKKQCPVCQLAGATLVLPDLPDAYVTRAQAAVQFVLIVKTFALRENQTPRLSQGPPASV